MSHVNTERGRTIIICILAAGCVSLLMTKWSDVSNYNDLVKYQERDCARRLVNGARADTRVEAQRQGERFDAHSLRLDHNFLEGSGKFRMASGQKRLARQSFYSAKIKGRIAVKKTANSKKLLSQILPNCDKEVPSRATFFGL